MVLRPLLGRAQGTLWVPSPTACSEDAAKNLTHTRLGGWS
jgi:hypothetical protein